MPSCKRNWWLPSNASLTSNSASAVLPPPVAKAPSDFVKPNRSKAAKNQPRKKRPHGFARKRETPTRRVVHAVEQCRQCDCPLRGGFIKRTRQVLHIPLVPVEVIEHAFLERRCPKCGLRNVPKDVLGTEVVGKHRVSAQTMALIATLREVGRLPIQTLQWYLATFHQLRLSVGERIDVLDTVRDQTTGLVQQLREELRASSVVHGDETGWREDGQNGYLWTFSTETIRYFVARRSRSGQVATEVLGDGFAGVLVSDFYAGYNRLEGLHQRCWAHLVRDVRKLQEEYPAEPQVQAWATAVLGVYHRARDWVRANPQANEAVRKRQQRQFEGELWQWCAPSVTQDVPQRVLCERVQRHLAELFVFVADLRVPSENNAAERSLRPVVISRKISGGTRSAEGSATKSALATLFGTWLVRGLNPFQACLAALTSPQL